MANEFDNFADIKLSELEHHGIDGQKWGKRNGPPYPLDSEDHSTAEKRAMDGNEKTRKINNLERSAKEFYDMQSKSLSEIKKITADIDRDKSKAGGLSKDVVSEIMYDSVVALIDPTKAVANLVDRAASAGIANIKEKAYLKNREQNCEIDPQTGLYKKNNVGLKLNSEQDCKKTNPAFRNFNSNTSNNCQLCTIAWDLRRRGYDVIAGKDSFGYAFANLKDLYPNAKLNMVSGLNDKGKWNKRSLWNNCETEILQQGNGARGQLAISYTTGGAHSMGYEVKNNKVVYYCPQSGNVYGGTSILSNFTHSKDPLYACTSGITYTRLDNIEPNYSKIKKQGVVI